MLYVSDYRQSPVFILAFRLDLFQSTEKILLSELYPLQIWDICQLSYLSEINEEFIFTKNKI